MQHEVKICGTTSTLDLVAAVRGRADSVGIITEPPGQEASGQTVTFKEAQELVRVARDFKIKSVVLPRTTDIAELLEMTDTLQPDRIQLGESEEPVLTAALQTWTQRKRPDIAQVIHVSDTTEPEQVDPFLEYADVIHLDTAGEHAGGNGVTHDWHISRAIAERVRERGASFIMLAGGLTAQNVLEAVEIVDPDGVDVQTGIKAPGSDEHDPEKVTLFVANARFALRNMWRRPEYRRKIPNASL